MEKLHHSCLARSEFVSVAGNNLWKSSITVVWQDSEFVSITGNNLRKSSIIVVWQDSEFVSVAGNNLRKSSISDVSEGFVFQRVMIFAKRFILNFEKVLNPLLQFILQLALDIYDLEVLAIYLLNLLNVFQHISTSIVHSQVHVKRNL